MGFKDLKKQFEEVIKVQTEAIRDGVNIADLAPLQGLFNNRALFEIAGNLDSLAVSLREISESQKIRAVAAGENALNGAALREAMQSLQDHVKGRAPLTPKMREEIIATVHWLNSRLQTGGVTWNDISLDSFIQTLVNELRARL